MFELLTRPPFRTQRFASFSPKLKKCQGYQEKAGLFVLGPESMAREDCIQNKTQDIKRSLVAESQFPVLILATPFDEIL